MVCFSLPLCERAFLAFRALQRRPREHLPRAPRRIRGRPLPVWLVPFETNLDITSLHCMPYSALQQSSVPEMSIIPGGASRGAAALPRNSVTPHPNHSSFLSIPHIYSDPMPHFTTNLTLWKLHEEQTLQMEPTDNDVASITETAREVRITEEQEEEDVIDDKPLDLSVRHLSPTPSTSSYTCYHGSPRLMHSPSPSLSIETERPSVIIENSSRPNQSSVRRSASSVGLGSTSSNSTMNIVHEHFRRSLSGKWPRRQKTDEEKSRASPFVRRSSFRECRIINHSTSSVEELFRKSLAPERFNKWKEQSH